MKLQSFASLASTNDDENVINEIIQDHPSIIKIKEYLNVTHLSEVFKFK